MSARWSEAPQDRWNTTGLSEPRPFLSGAPPLSWTGDGVTTDDGSGLVKGVLYALAAEALALAAAALLILAGIVIWRASAHHEAPPPAPLPAIYSQCVLNAHVSDVCLGA